MSPRFQSNRPRLSGSSDYIALSHIMTSHFKKRTLWHSYTDERVPYASCMVYVFTSKAPNTQGGNATSVLDSLQYLTSMGSVTDIKNFMVKDMPEKDIGLK